MRSFSFLHRAAVMAVRVLSLDEPASDPYSTSHSLLLSYLDAQQNPTWLCMSFSFLHKAAVMAVCVLSLEDPASVRYSIWVI